MAESTTQSVITDEMRAQIGVEGQATLHEVTSTGCRLFARAVGHIDLVFYDAEVARERGYRDILAPPGYLGTPVYPPVGRGEGGEGAPMGGGLKIPYKRILNGGTTYEYMEPICAGDVISSRSQVAEFQERTGSIGPMLIVYRETTYTREDGAVVAKMYGNIIHY
ncbi:MAG: MaoC family dehydratase N-terminal domain-containing protein [Dehalococcoidia bacterium]